MIAYIQTSCKRADGTRYCFGTFATDAKVNELPWQKAGLTWTASGYGRKIPTRYMVRLHGKWRRVYACQISNAGTLYVGKMSDGIYVRDISEQ